MNWLRNALIGGILVVVFLLFIRWNEFQENKVAINAASQETITADADIPIENNAIETPSAVAASDEDIPLAPNQADQSLQDDDQPAKSTALIKVDTDSFHILIDPKGGDIVKVSLAKYLADIEDKESSFILLNRSASHTYVAESDLVGPNGTHTAKTGRQLYSSAATSYQLGEGQDELSVDLTLVQNGVDITKRFTFKRDSYLIQVEYIVNNRSSETWKAAMYGRIKRDGYEPPSETGFGVQPYLGAAITTAETNYKKIDFEDIDEGKIEHSNKGGWVAMIQHYFVSAWVPNPEDENKYSLQKSGNKKYYLMGYTSPLYSVAPGQQETISSSFYVGPKIIKNLEKVSPHLDLTIDFSWLWFIAKPLFLALDFIHGFVGNWGIAIILLTCLVKIIFFYPSAMAYRSMAKMRKVMPLMQELKERYGDDRQRMGMETMKLYKKEGVNPLGGCLPMLLQMPVFIALYWALMESVELRHSPFFFWIVDLSIKDPYFILPLIFGASMFFQQKLNPPPTDPMQAKVMQLMPIFFTFLFMMFPAGLVLYWVTNNALSITQQYIITKQIENS
ncbi:membrane protein insertase YidC [Agarilytica rhodophyticola]|uniref:membrane protein insertase YidC n=1 Tax=Agarilytica rhodophyticola TaxID=1737490 RepID=UPI000B34351B|nr:membrane protein insertase YidC [Agarilytica rhodophyticola]